HRTKLPHWSIAQVRFPVPEHHRHLSMTWFCHILQGATTQDRRRDKELSRSSGQTSWCKGWKEANGSAMFNRQLALTGPLGEVSQGTTNCGPFRQLSATCGLGPGELEP